MLFLHPHTYTQCSDAHSYFNLAIILSPPSNLNIKHGSCIFSLLAIELFWVSSDDMILFRVQKTWLWPNNPASSLFLLGLLSAPISIGKQRFLESFSEVCPIPLPLSWNGLECQIKKPQEGKMESVLKPTVTCLSFPLQLTFTVTSGFVQMNQAVTESLYWYWYRGLSPLLEFSFRTWPQLFIKSEEVTVPASGCAKPGYLTLCHLWGSLQK